MKYWIFIIIILLSVQILLADTAAQILQNSYTLEAKKDYKKAIELMKILEKSDTNDEFYTVRLGWLYYASYDYQKSFEYYQKSNDLSSSIEAKEGMLNSLLALRRWNDTILYGSQFLKEFPRNSIFIVKIGYAYYMKRDYSNAVLYYKEYCNYYKWDFNGQTYLLRSYYLAGDLQSAKQVYLKFKKYMPQSTIINEFAEKLK